MENPPSAITTEEIKQALLNSGYLLENRVLGFFQSVGVNATTNVHFPADAEGIFREIDILAITEIGFVKLGENLESLSVYLHFVAECINNSQPLGVFENLTDAKLNPEIVLCVMVNGDPDLRERSSLTWDYAVETTASEIRPAKQYCGFMLKKERKNGTWMASHPEDFHKTLTKLVQFSKYRLNQIDSIWNGRRPQMCRIDVVIPIVVLQGDIVEIKNSAELEIDSTKFYKLNVPYGEQVYATIDLVCEQHLKEYFDNKMSKFRMMFDYLNKELLMHFKKDNS